MHLNSPPSFCRSREAKDGRSTRRKVLRNSRAELAVADNTVAFLCAGDGMRMSAAARQPCNPRTSRSSNDRGRGVSRSPAASPLRSRSPILSPLRGRTPPASPLRAKTPPGSPLHARFDDTDRQSYVLREAAATAVRYHAFLASTTEQHATSEDHGSSSRCALAVLFTLLSCWVLHPPHADDLACVTAAPGETGALDRRGVPLLFLEPRRQRTFFMGKLSTKQNHRTTPGRPLWQIFGI